jgi:hypothetical protein
LKDRHSSSMPFQALVHCPPTPFQKPMPSQVSPGLT